MLRAEPAAADDVTNPEKSPIKGESGPPSAWAKENKEAPSCQCCSPNFVIMRQIIDPPSSSSFRTKKPTPRIGRPQEIRDTRTSAVKLRTPATHSSVAIDDPKHDSSKSGETTR